MAKTTAPLLSFGAGGQIGKAMVASKWRGISYFRQYVIPANPKTAAQSLTRNLFATLRLMWKVAGPIQRAPFDSFASGRPFLGLNAFIGENIKTMRAETDMDLYIGSPGAKGGLAMVSAVASTGSGSGEVDCTITEPALPAGWTITAAQAVGFPDQDPADAFVGPLVEGEDVATPFVITLTGLGSAVACQAAMFIKYVKPNGDTAYSVGVTDQATSGA